MKVGGIIGMALVFGTIGYVTGRVVQLEKTIELVINCTKDTTIAKDIAASISKAILFPDKDTAKEEHQWL